MSPDKPGYLLFGAGGSTKKYRSLDETDWFEIPGEGLEVDRTHHTFDVAAYLHQVFWQAAGDVKRHADFFMGGTIGDDNPNFGRWNLFASIETFGLMASRPARTGWEFPGGTAASPATSSTCCPIIDFRAAGHVGRRTLLQL